MTTLNEGWAAWRRNFGDAHEAYLLALLQDSTCNGTARHDNCAGEGCDRDLWYLGYDGDSITPGACREIEEDLHGFVTSCLAERPGAFDDITADMVGHDFYLTRNGHGVGFWDRDLGEVGDWLTAMTKPFREASLYLGDDGNVYYSNR